MERVGQIIGNYRIESLLGVGGMGQVFLGAHLHLNRKAAIKIMHSHLEVDPGFRERFVREARAAAALSHPNIVETYDFGEQDGLFYLVMEAVLDGSLTTLLHPPAGSNATLPLHRGLDLVRQAGEGLAHAHAQGMVHRDVKPDNLLLKLTDDGYQVKVCDFGLVRIVEGAAATAAGMMMGTPVYMSPEQCQGLTLDSRSDQYSLGIVLYEVATGQRPFDASSPSDILFQQINEAPMSPRSVRPEISADLSAIIERCLAKKPDERFPTTEALVAALRTVQSAADADYARFTVPFSPVAAHEPSTALEGRQLARYRVDALQQSGALTWDYLAFHTGLEMAVVLKVLRPELANDAALAEKFQREVRVAAGMRHPGLVEVLDTGVAEGFSFVVLDAAEGRTLLQELQRRRLNPLEVLACLQQVAEALDYAHTHGAAVRDVQPANIMLDADGSAVLLDIGDVTLAEQRAVEGRPPSNSRIPYVAPERVRGDADTSAAGIYALGCLAYELLAGSPPFSGLPATGSGNDAPSDPRLGLLSEVPDIGPLAGTVIARALSRTPEDRFASGAEFVRVLTAALTDDASTPRSVSAMAVAGAHTPTSSSTIPSLDSSPPVAPPADDGAVDSVPENSPPAESMPLTPAKRWPLTKIGAIALVAVLAIGATFWFLRDDGGDDGGPTPTTTDELSGSNATSTALAALAATTATVSQAVTSAATTPSATEKPAAAISASATAEAAVTPTTEPSPTITPSPTVAATPTFDVFVAMRTGLIAFVTGRRPDNAGIPDVYVMAPDGSDQRRLLTIAAADAYPSSDPDWSSNGTRMAFTSSRDGNNEIYTMGVDGTDLNNITNNQASDTDADWSPDDDLIAFVSNRDGNYEIYVMEASGANPRNLSNSQGTDWGPDWSPDGSKIVFVSDRNGANQIFIMNPDGSGLQALTNEPGAQDYNPAWSPDGTMIAFARNPGDEFHIFLMNADGSDVRQITANPGQDSTPTWSPDGSQILFRGTRDGNADVYIMNHDGSDQRRLTDNPTYDGSPVWAPVPSE